MNTREQILARWILGVTSHCAEETESLAGELAGIFPIDTTLALHGDLGAGKTTFTRGFAKAIGVQDSVTSPTYALFRTHRGSDGRLLAHMDAYRLSRPEEADALLLWELLDSPWTLVVEWPSKLGDRLPEDAWHLDFSTAEDGLHSFRLRRPASRDFS
jgi:tRNA threonylcarbamoyladenosine biosynthesis protein TsaE